MNLQQAIQLIRIISNDIDTSLTTDMLANLIKVNLHDANTIHFNTRDTQMAQISNEEKEIIHELDKRTEKRSTCSLEINSKYSHEL